MATIFISHSSRDDALASQLEAWLVASGFTDLFIDHSHISGGEAWADALRANAGSARVVLCLVTPNWLASTECPSEFKAAWYMGKRIIPLFLLGKETALDEKQRSELGRVRAEAQGLDLAPFMTPEGLHLAAFPDRAEMLKRGLKEAGALAAVGLDPNAFEIDRSLRPSPFPGLTSFGDEDADAALFFGRSREIAEVLETLRKMRAASEANPLVILGASGSGKSSLLKAGIIPRLRREAPAWLPLRSFRPGADPLLNFAEAITKTLADFGEREAHGALKRTLLQIWQSAPRSEQGELKPEGRAMLASGLEEQAARLRTRANRPNATILISVDQAEELTRSDGDSGQALADYLRAAMEATSPFRLAFTIRTDSFPELQAHPRFQGLEARGYDLRTLPVFRFDDVAEDPAARYGVAVDPALTDALMEDAPGKDALPLLAFALQRLWDQFHVSGKLTHADYTAMGGLSGLIEDAAERALCGIEPEQRDTALPAGGAKAHQVELGQSVFVPALADVNDEGAAIRRVAAWEEFSPQQQDLLERFDRWRLVVRKEGDGDGATVEVAHEA
ncbi:MAG: toll/interleukin-1 receptor domain-containing protein, partial [Pseudomonadota bacterium]